MVANLEIRRPVSKTHQNRQSSNSNFEVAVSLLETVIKDALITTKTKAVVFAEFEICDDDHPYRGQSGSY